MKTESFVMGHLCDTSCAKPCEKARADYRQFPIIGEIREERWRQLDKWGPQRHNALYWLGILMEEVGELAKAIIERKPLEARKELIQVVAVGMAWLEEWDASL